MLGELRRFGHIALGAAIMLSAALGVSGAAAPASAAAVFTTLRFEEMKCYNETDEAGNDSPYFIVFVGEPDGSSTTMRIRKSWWDNEVFDDYVSKPHHTVRSGVNLNSLIITMLIEEDDNPDISTSYVASTIATDMANEWQFHLADSPSVQVAWMRWRLDESVFPHLDNDELVDIEALRVTTTLMSGALMSVHLVGYGGDYKVWYKMI